MLVGGEGVAAPSELSRVPGFACMRPSPADPRQPGGPLLGFSRMRSRRAVALLLPLLVWVLCCLGVSLLCLESRVCLRTLQSDLVLNVYPKSCIYAFCDAPPLE